MSLNSNHLAWEMPSLKLTQQHLKRMASQKRESLPVPSTEQRGDVMWVSRRVFLHLVPRPNFLCVWKKPWPLRIGTGVAKFSHITSSSTSILFFLRSSVRWNTSIRICSSVLQQKMAGVIIKLVQWNWQWWVWSSTFWMFFFETLDLPPPPRMRNSHHQDYVHF